MKTYFEKIAKLPFVGDCRQCGLMGGIEIVKNKDTKESFDYEQAVGAKLCQTMRSKGAMMRPLGDVIVLMPAVAMDIETLEKLLGIVAETIEHDLPKIVDGLN